MRLLTHRSTHAARAGLGAILVLLALAPHQAHAQVLRANSLALMNFSNASLINAADYAPLEWAIPELIGTRLARNPLLDIVDRRRLQALLDEQNLGASGRVSPESAAGVGRVLGARYMMFGTFLLDRRNRLRLDARVLDVETSKIVATETVRDVDWNEDVSFVVDSLAERFARNLRLPRRAPGASTGEASGAPATEGTAPIAGAPTTRSDAPPESPAGTPSSAVSGQVATAVPTMSPSRSAGLVTLGRALRLGTARASDRTQAVSLLRTAARETPSLTRDVEDILKRWSAGSN